MIRVAWWWLVVIAFLSGYIPLCSLIYTAEVVLAVLSTPDRRPTSWYSWGWGLRNAFLGGYFPLRPLIYTFKVVRTVLIAPNRSLTWR